VLRKARSRMFLYLIELDQQEIVIYMFYINIPPKKGTGELLILNCWTSSMLFYLFWIWKGYFHSTMRMHKARKGFLRLRQNSARCGLSGCGLPRRCCLFWPAAVAAAPAFWPPAPLGPIVVPFMVSGMFAMAIESMPWREL